jgi:hypothetical protein
MQVISRISAEASQNNQIAGDYAESCNSYYTANRGKAKRAATHRARLSLRRCCATMTPASALYLPRGIDSIIKIEVPR